MSTAQQTLSVVFRVREGKIISITSYADQLHAMRELGLDPSQIE